MNILIYSLFNHFLNDFILQSSRVVERKNNKEISAFIYHTSLLIPVFLVVKLIGLHNIIAKDVVYIIIISLIHFVIDRCKVSLESSEKLNSVQAFTLDQVLHIVAVIMVSEFFYLNNIALTNYDRIIWTITILIAVCLGGSVLTDLVFKETIEKSRNTIKNSDEVIGKWIGIIERLLIIILININSIETIGFIIAAKSLYRGSFSSSKEINKDYQNYYILGTLLSFAVGITGAILIKYLDKIAFNLL